MMRNKYSKFFALLKQVNSNGLTLSKEDAVLDYTNGRTKSLSDLSPLELQGIERTLQSLTTQKELHISPDDITRDKMRKAIISQFKSIGRTAKAAKEWAEKYGVFGVKKDFNDYNEQELYQLIRNAEKVKQDFNKALNR